MIETQLTALLKLDAPVIQAPVGAWPELTAAVSNAGGLGLLQSSWLTESSLRHAIRATRQLTDRPFGINLVLNESREQLLDAALDEDVSVITLFWGDPGPYVTRAHEAGAVVTHSVGSAEEARRAVGCGVDVIVAQGWEAGGHVRGHVAGLALVPAVKAAVGAIPVVAAGGIADGRGLAAALALGADGVWMGTRFIASPEADFSSEYKQGVLAADETAPVHTGLFDIGWPDAPHRVLPNSTFRRWEAAGRPDPGARPGEGDTVAVAPDGEALPRYGFTDPISGIRGDLEALAHYAGQSAGMIRDIKPAGDIVRDTASQAREILRGLAFQ